ncbi:DUF5672 family protein [Novosphingobium sp.]|uniref:DUF5672 family protein n=1 Tax=Novosphingobium sp. TaxID=1874826 RepID=UPI0035B38B08
MASPPHLPTVTLAAVTSVAIEATVEAMHRSMRQLRFGAAKLFTDQPAPPGCHPDIEVVPIPRLSSREAYSRFMLRGMAGAIDTAHVMVVQWDGFVLDGARWDERWLALDYIGAPWPQFDDGMDVGNGGFSLRSRRLLAALAELAPDTEEAEDIVIARQLRPQLEALGMRFAARETAANFAFERTRRQGTELGFHGAFNLPGLLSARDLRWFLQRVEPGLINPRDLRTMLAGCLVRADMGNAIRLLMRLAR